MNNLGMTLVVIGLLGYSIWMNNRVSKIEDFLNKRSVPLCENGQSTPCVNNIK